MHGGKQKLLLLALIVVAAFSWEVGKLAAQTWQKVVPSGGEWQCGFAAYGAGYILACAKPSTGRTCTIINPHVATTSWFCENKSGGPL